MVSIDLLQDTAHPIASYLSNLGVRWVPHIGWACFLPEGAGPQPGYPFGFKPAPEWPGGLCPASASTALHETVRSA